MKVKDTIAAGSIRIATIGEFLSSLNTRVILDLARQYNRKVQNSSSGLDNLYERAEYYLTKENLGNLFGSVKPVLKTLLVQAETFQGMVEDAAVLSVEQYGKPNFLVYGTDERFYCIDSRNFEILLKFDEVGQLFGTLVCYDTTNSFGFVPNIKALQDWGYAELEPQEETEELLKQVRNLYWSKS